MLHWLKDVLCVCLCIINMSLCRTRIKSSKLRFFAYIFYIYDVLVHFVTFNIKKKPTLYVDLGYKYHRFAIAREKRKYNNDEQKSTISYIGRLLLNSILCVCKKKKMRWSCFWRKRKIRNTNYGNAHIKGTYQLGNRLAKKKMKAISIVFLLS